MEINTILILVLLFIFYLIIPTFLVFIKNYKIQNLLSIFYLIVFSLLLIIGVFSKIEITKINTKISFDFSYNWFSKNFNFKFWEIDLADFLINITMLFPLGYCSNFLFKKKYKILFSFLLGFFVGGLIEICQFILPIMRSPQLSDIILNSISCLIGGIYFKLLRIYKIKKLIIKNK